MRDEPPAVFTQPPSPSSADHQFDPLQLCIYTTIGIVAWLVTPAVVVAVFGAIGFIAYVRARRRGLAQSRCKLGDTRLVIAYLAIAASVAMAITLTKVLDLLTL